MNNASTTSISLPTTLPMGAKSIALKRTEQTCFYDDEILVDKVGMKFIQKTQKLKRQIVGIDLNEQKYNEPEMARRRSSVAKQEAMELGLKRSVRILSQLKRHVGAINDKVGAIERRSELMATEVRSFRRASRGMRGSRRSLSSRGRFSVGGRRSRGRGRGRGISKEPSLTEEAIELTEHKPSRGRGRGKKKKAGNRQYSEIQSKSTDSQSKTIENEVQDRDSHEEEEAKQEIEEQPPEEPWLEVDQYIAPVVEETVHRRGGRASVPDIDPVIDEVLPDAAAEQPYQDEYGDYDGQYGEDGNLAEEYGVIRVQIVKP